MRLTRREPSPNELFVSGIFADALRDHLFEAAVDDPLRLAHDVVDEFLAGRDIVDQTLGLAGRPDAEIRIARVIDLAATCSGDEIAHILELGIATALDGDHFLADLVPR